jgi:IclR family KDG regulon transcriptional repressor
MVPASVGKRIKVTATRVNNLFNLLHKGLAAGMMNSMSESMGKNSLERALDLVEVIAGTRGGLRNADLSRQLGIPKSTCSYITKRLERAGYLNRDADSRRFRIGLKTVALAHGALREVGLHSVAEPALYRLTAETGLSAGIGVLQAGHVLLIDRVEGPRFVDQAMRDPAKPLHRVGPYRTREQRDIGRELPVHSTALGKVLLAYLGQPQLLDLLPNVRFEKRTARTIISRSRFLSELELVRRRGYATADEEEYADVRALSAPIFDAAGVVRAAVSVNGSPKELVWNDLPELVRLVQIAARGISKRMRN